MMIARNTKTNKEEEEEEDDFHILSRFYTSLKSLLIRFSFVSKHWFHDHSPPTLSNDIIFFSILNRLPSKSLLRFSCVSKLWYNTIHDDPFFIYSHFNHSKSKPSSLLISTTKSKSGTHTHFKYLDEEEEQQQQEASSYTMIANFKNNRSQVIGSVNGLTCFNTSSFIEVCNPSTHEIIAIPYPPPIGYDIYDLCCYGFGFDPLMNQYKILRVTEQFPDSICQIFTLGPGPGPARADQDCVCRDITVTSHLSRLFLQLFEWDVTYPFIFSNGALFKPVPCTNTIIMFDIHYETFQKIPGLQVSHDIDDDDFISLYTTCEFRGCPYVVYRAELVDGYMFSFYALKKQQSSNTNVVGNIHFHLVFEQAIRIPRIVKHFSLLSFAEFSGKILVQWVEMLNRNRFYVYNPHTERLQKGVFGLSFNSSVYSVLFVEHIDNLLSLKKLVPGAPATEVKYLSSREATMHDEGSSTTLSPMSMLCCFGLSAKKHRGQDMTILCLDNISRFKSR